jgi:hypothetical protein
MGRCEMERCETLREEWPVRMIGNRLFLLTILRDLSLWFKLNESK